MVIWSGDWRAGKEGEGGQGGRHRGRQNGRQYGRRQYGGQDGRQGQDGQEAWFDSGMEQFLKGRGCRRRVLDGVMDGFEERGGCEESEERCDVCGTEQDEDSEGEMEFERVECEGDDEERMERMEVEDRQVVQSEEGFWQDIRVRRHAKRVRIATTGSRGRARYIKRYGRKGRK